MKNRFKILALFIFLLMLGSWYFTSDVDVKVKTYPNIKFQQKEDKTVLNKHHYSISSNNWDMSGIYNVPDKEKLSLRSNVDSHFNLLKRNNQSYVKEKNNLINDKRLLISGPSNVKYGRTSSVRNGTLMVNSTTPVYNKLIVGNRGLDLLTSDVILTGQRFGASAPCKPGFKHELGPDGRCIHCGATLSAAGDGTGEIEWVPIDDSIYPLLLLGLSYFLLLMYKRNI